MRGRWTMPKPRTMAGWFLRLMGGDSRGRRRRSGRRRKGGRGHGRGGAATRSRGGRRRARPLGGGGAAAVGGPGGGAPAPAPGARDDPLRQVVELEHAAAGRADPLLAADPALERDRVVVVDEQLGVVVDREAAGGEPLPELAVLKVERDSGVEAA